MPKAMNNITVKQILVIKTFLDAQEEQGIKVDNLAELAAITQQKVGFTVTISNMNRVFREFELTKGNYIKKYGGNSMMIQISTLRLAVEKLEHDQKVIYKALANVIEQCDLNVVLPRINDSDY